MDDTVGRLQSCFTQEQLDIIVGTLLGDGRLEQRSKGIRGYSARLRIHHGDKQKEYVFWKYRILKNYVGAPPKRIVCGYNRKQGRYYHSWYFHTKSASEFRILYDLFYREDKKIVPDSIEKLLTPRALAVWIMDDGCYAKPEFHINTQSFTLEEQNRLQEILKQKFGIVSVLRPDRKQWRIAVKSKSTPSLFKIVEPYIIPTMRYKIVIPVSTEAEKPRSGIFIPDNTSDPQNTEDKV
jgi:hypothetical protein